jgi:hypothetical protein
LDLGMGHQGASASQSRALPRVPVTALRVCVTTRAAKVLMSSSAPAPAPRRSASRSSAGSCSPAAVEAASATASAGQREAPGCAPAH